MYYWNCAKIDYLNSLLETDRPTYGQTNRRKDRPTDRPTDIATYRAPIAAKNNLPQQPPLQNFNKFNNFDHTNFTNVSNFNNFNNKGNKWNQEVNAEIYNVLVKTSKKPQKI